MTTTMKANLVNAEVFAQSLNDKLGDALVLAPVLYRESFQGQKVGSISVAKYTYIGDADIVAEGQPIDPTLLTQSAESVSIVKVAKGITITDEAVMSAIGDPVGKGEEQLIRSIANGIEKELIASLDSAIAVSPETGAAVNSDVLINAIQLFGEDMDGDKFLIVNPNQYGNIKRDPNFVDGKLLDVQVIFTNRVPVDKAYLAKPGSLGLYTARAVDVEEARDIVNKKTVITSDAFIAQHLRDDSGVVKITLTV